MGQALYRKYRTKTLNETIGQEHITGTLTRALQAGHISHAYLFTGPRGVGKTSVARILAHEVNGLPYADDSSHLDIIEIDAASNRRIDEIRDLRDRVYIAPTSATYKVYIIDEVHMLTREAFNALLKTLEEPPAHVIFILATTEAHKLPETIVSRTQHFTFRPIPIDKVVAHLREIATAEHISIDDTALELIARHGEGSFRDSISLLDQARTMATDLDVTAIESMLGLAPDEGVAALIEAVEAGQPSEVVQRLQQLREQGFEAAQLAKQLGQAWRSRLLAQQSALTSEAVLTLLERLLRISSSNDPFALLEITLLQAAPTVAPARMHVAQPTVPAPEPVQAAVAPAPPAPQAKAKETPTGNATFTTTLWPQILDTIKQNYNTLYGVVRMAEPQFSDNRLTLGFRFAFHQKRVNEARNKKIITGIIHELTGQNIEIVCELDPNAKETPSSKPETAATTTEAPDDPLQTISNIFGGAELLESEN